MTDDKAPNPKEKPIKDQIDDAWLGGQKQALEFINDVLDGKNAGNIGYYPVSGMCDTIRARLRKLMGNP